MEDFKELIEDHFCQYASYVILDRAIPDVEDGLKPVQRRILWTLHAMDDGKLHKVANVAGQTMAYHPHGDAAITDALVHMSNKGYLLDQQGNFGNLFTGDPAAASRYIETRLSPLAKQTLFNAQLTQLVPSYDGRKKEPVALPAKIPIILLHGIDGIAVGMSTHIFPHNFVEVLQAQIAYLQNQPYEIYPDFPTGGLMDPSDYDRGRGKVKLQALIEPSDAKTLIVREICYGTTTESLIRSIDEAAKKGRLKIESIHDYTAEEVEIEIKLARGTKSQDVLAALYHYTECQVTLHSNLTVIKDKQPWEPTTHEILEYLTEKLTQYLRAELAHEKGVLEEKIFFKSLERLFIEEKMYRKIEKEEVYDKVHESIAKAFVAHHASLLRVPTYEDREKLLSLPIRRISKYDLNKNRKETQDCVDRLAQVEHHLAHLTPYTIAYLQDLIDTYGASYPRRTDLGQIAEIDTKALVKKEITLYCDLETGFLGTQVSSGQALSCTNLDKIVLFYDDGSYKVVPPPDKLYVHGKTSRVVRVLPADKKTALTCVYRHPQTKIAFIKRFIVKTFILEKSYAYFEPSHELLLLTNHVQGSLAVQFVPKPKQKLKKMSLLIENTLIKGVSAKGVRVSSRPVKRVLLGKDVPDDQMTLF